MLALLTSCGRFDLLKETLESLYKNQQSEFFLTITEDGLTKSGQNNCIESFLVNATGKYYLHLEDDWEFENSCDWIKKSIEIMESDPTIIKVLCRKDTEHPCQHKDGFGYIQPWESPDKILWHGFSWNPGVTRLDYLKKFIPFPRWEQELASEIYNAGYSVVELENKIYKHIGYGRSTH